MERLSENINRTASPLKWGNRGYNFDRIDNKTRAYPLPYQGNKEEEPSRSC